METILKAIQLLYQSGQKTLEELSYEYSIPIQTLQAQNWVKSNLVIPKTTPVPEPTHNNSIEEAKTKALDVAIDLLNDNTITPLSTKELKDIVSVIDTIEKSYQKHSDQPTINIAIQNLVERFKDDI